MIGLISNNDVWDDRHKVIAFYFDQMALMVPDIWTNERVHEPRSAVPKLTDMGILTPIPYVATDHEEAARTIIEAVHRWPDEIRAVAEFSRYWPRQGGRADMEEGWHDPLMAHVLSDHNLGYTKSGTFGEATFRTARTIADIYNSRLAEITATRLGFNLTGLAHAPYPGASTWKAETVRDVIVTSQFTGPIDFHSSTAQPGSTGRTLIRRS